MSLTVPETVRGDGGGHETAGQAPLRSARGAFMSRACSRRWRGVGRASATHLSSPPIKHTRARARARREHRHASPLLEHAAPAAGWPLAVHVAAQSKADAKRGSAHRAPADMRVTNVATCQGLAQACTVCGHRSVAGSGTGRVTRAGPGWLQVRAGPGRLRGRARTPQFAREGQGLVICVGASRVQTWFAGMTSW